MQELIKITEREGQQAVSARELHVFLESKKDFSSWIKDRIERYDFIENHDYTVFTQIGENSKGGRPAIEYALTLDAAKELSMVEGNEKGKQARKYFIECEKKVKGQMLPDFNNPVLAARAWADEYEQKMLAQQKVNELAPKAEVYDDMISSDGLFSMQGAGNVLGYGRTKFMALLRGMDILQKNNIAYRKYIDAGYFVEKIRPVNGVNYTTTFVTTKGIDYLKKKLNDKK